MRTSETTWLRRAPGAGAREVGGNVVVASNGRAYELSEEGGLIWKLANGARTIDEIAKAMAAEYDVDLAVVRADVEAFADEMAAEGFVVLASEPTGEGGENADWTNRVPGAPHFDPATYDRFIHEDVPAYERLQDAVAEAGGVVERPRRILDLGTGTGETARRVLGRHPQAELVAVDASAAMLEAAQARLHGTNATFCIGRLEEPLPTGPYDLVVSALAVHRIPDEEKRRLFERIARVLVRDGAFVLGDAVEAPPGEATTAFYPGHDHPASLEAHLAWLEAAGFAPEPRWHEADLVVIVARPRGGVSSS
jgi:tRNA (cmo5U34)-methyltransferase